MFATASICPQRVAPFNPHEVSRWSLSPIAMKRLSRTHPKAATWVSRDGAQTMLGGDKPQRTQESFGRLGSTTRTRAYLHGWSRHCPVVSSGGDTRMSVGGKAPPRLLCCASSGKNPEWRPFTEARDYAKSLGLMSEKEWLEWSKSEERPSDIPDTPDRVYKEEEWKSWGDFLGFNKGVVAGQWRSFEEARDYVGSLGLESHKEWNEWMNSEERPSDIPSEPDKVYKDKGWKNYGDFLGYKEGYVAGIWLPFEEARDYVRSLCLVSKNEWKEWSKSEEKPPDIPSSPDQVYKDKGWQSYGDFLGYNEGNVAGKWRAFEEARDYVRSLGLVSKDGFIEWRKSGERPPDVPYNPHRAYKDNGWKSWGDFLAGYQ